MKNPDIGVTPSDDAKRDAIHVAIIPVIAGQALRPGQHVGRISKDRFGESDHPLGIVDPFLKEFVQSEGRFWLFLYQKTVTSIRHHWMHDAFPDELTETERLAEVVLSSDSEEWLKKYAERFYSTANGDPYQTLLSDLREGQVVYRGSDMHSRGELEDEAELKFHAENILGIKLNFNDFHFGCSC